MSSNLAYYNEHDAFAAAWLRKLIEANLIAPGVVDDRDIRDVTPADLMGFTQVHLFAGIGGWSLALRQAGVPDDYPLWTGSCPCQSFSAAGKRLGFADERHLWPAMFWLASVLRPELILGEQVASKDALAWLDLVSSDLEGAGYTFGATDTCAAGFGAPHIRQRLHWVAVSERWRREGPHIPVRPARQVEAETIERGSTEGLADTEYPDRGTELGLDGNPHGRNGFGGSRDFDRLDDSAGSRHEPEGVGAEGETWDEARLRGPECGCPTDGLADPDGRDTCSEREQRSGEQRLLSEGGGPCNGFWRNAEWLDCRDGKKRPTEPGTFPLAHGTTNRVGRLRGYGNAICVPQTALWIEAVMKLIR
jgi:DNA (cytosine-5)-methyltransferase 1